MENMHSSYLHPRYWPTWLGIVLLRLTIKLPWRLQMWLGKQLGLLMFLVLKERRFICCVNLELAFPELSQTERKTLARAHFVSLGQGLLEAALSWWGSDKALQSITSIEGMEHLQTTRQDGGVVLLSAHFTSLELGGRLLAPHLPLHVVYKPHKNKLIEATVATLRTQRYGKAISRDNIRAMLQSLKQKQVVWYAQDQHFNRKNNLFVPFFGVEAATNTATSRISGIGKAKVVPFFTVRQKNGYLLRFLPALDNFPSGSVEADTARINRIIEQQVREFPAQYLWTHRRYKTAPDGSNRYKSYAEKHPKRCC